ncbi:hypothetical protein DFJ74DRAFT_765222, partial [Hyaloraphidium curvatum]
AGPGVHNYARPSSATAPLLLWRPQLAGRELHSSFSLREEVSCRPVQDARDARRPAARRPPRHAGAARLAARLCAVAARPPLLRLLAQAALTRRRLRGRRSGTLRRPPVHRHRVDARAALPRPAVARGERGGRRRLRRIAVGRPGGGPQAGHDLAHAGGRDAQGEQGDGEHRLRSTARRGDEGESEGELDVLRVDEPGGLLVPHSDRGSLPRPALGRQPRVHGQRRPHGLSLGQSLDRPAGHPEVDRAVRGLDSLPGASGRGRREHSLHYVRGGARAGVWVAGLRRERPGQLVRRRRPRHGPPPRRPPPPRVVGSSPLDLRGGRRPPPQLPHQGDAPRPPPRGRAHHRVRHLGLGVRVVRRAEVPVQRRHPALVRVPAEDPGGVHGRRGEGVGAGVVPAAGGGGLPKVEIHADQREGEDAGGGADDDDRGACGGDDNSGAGCGYDPDQRCRPADDGNGGRTQHGIAGRPDHGNNYRCLAGRLGFLLGRQHHHPSRNLQYHHPSPIRQRLDTGGPDDAPSCSIEHGSAGERHDRPEHLLRRAGRGVGLGCRVRVRGDLGCCFCGGV